MPQYPYLSRERKELVKRRERRDYSVWQKPGFDLQKTVSKLQGSIIEIGGPTLDGFYFLDDLVLPCDVLITNISRSPMPFANEAEEAAALVRQVVDGRKLPFDDGEAAAFLMAGMSITNDWYLSLSEKEQDANADKIKSEFEIAELELEQVALGTLKPKAVKYAQRVQIYLEVARVLTEGGLFFTDGTLAEVVILKTLGFELLAYTQERIRPDEGGDVILYEFVMEKQ